MIRDHHGLPPIPFEDDNTRSPLPGDAPGNVPGLTDRRRGGVRSTQRMINGGHPCSGISHLNPDARRPRVGTVLPGCDAPRRPPNGRVGRDGARSPMDQARVDNFVEDWRPKSTGRWLWCSSGLVIFSSNSCLQWERSPVPNNKHRRWVGMLPRRQRGRGEFVADQLAWDGKGDGKGDGGNYCGRER
jgi:hypothetical protein